MTKLAKNAQAIADLGSRMDPMFAGGDREVGDEWPDRWAHMEHGGRYLLAPHMSSGDYSGSLAERSNREVFAEQFAEGRDVWWTELRESYSTRSIVIDLHADISDDCVEFFEALSEYPVADEEHWCELEESERQRQWAEDGIGDFRRALVKAAPEHLESIFENLPDCALTEWYWEALEGGNGPEFEGLTCLFELDGAVEFVFDRLEVENCKPAVDPIALYRADPINVLSWTAEDTETHRRYQAMADSLNY